MNNVGNGYEYAAMAQKQAQAQAQAQYYPDTSGAIEAPQPALMSELSSRLQTLAMLVGDAGGDLASLSDRLFGAIPRGVAGSAGQANKPSGQMSELLIGLEIIIERASAVREEARSLNSRI